MTDRTDRDNHLTNDTCPCNIDPRERHIVCKLDRYELEDRYLRMLGEMHTLKKLSNDQEDKIKRLATKLMRYGANPRSCVGAVDQSNNREKLSHLEAENSKLRNKLCILRNQLVNNKIFARSPPRNRRIGSTSGLITCRSEGSRLKAASSCQCISAQPGNDGNDVQNYSLKIQEMENEKKEMLSRIADLEAELASFSTENRREKVAENVEYIRVWRQMQRQNEKLLSIQAANDILNEQIFKLKNQLEESNKRHTEVSAELDVERMQVAQLDESISRSRESQVDTREKDERIMDLTNEKEILKQHNQELLELSSKFSQIEKANAEYKRKIAEQASELQVSKDFLNIEKTNNVALQSANNRLLVKVQDLQKNIDLMSMQLMERRSIRPTKKFDKKSSNVSFSNECNMNKESLSKNSETCDKSPIFVKTTNPELREQGVQAGEKNEAISQVTQTEKVNDYSAKLKDDDTIETFEISQSQPRNGTNLSREEMIKLLDRVQINVPAESQNQNAARILRSESTPVNFRSRRQVTKLEALLFGDSKV